MLSTRNPLQTSRHIKTESERMEKYIPCKWEAKESWSSNPHIRQIDLKIKMTTRDKEGHYIMIKGAIQEEDITVVNIYAPNIDSDAGRDWRQEEKGTTEDEMAGWPH